MPARSPLTAASCNARVGPTAMSIIRSNCFTPPKQSRTPSLHMYQKHPSGRLCWDVFASESAAKIIPARAAMPSIRLSRKVKCSRYTKASDRASDFLQNPVHNLLRHLQQLRRHRHRNHLRQLTLHPRNTNRRRDTRKVLRAKTPLL